MALADTLYKGEHAMSDEPSNKTFESLQEEMLKKMQEFSRSNPEIMEAMDVMNMSMADYIEAMDSVRSTQIFSCSTSSRLPSEVEY
jgi:hypothetical protein